jgi:hypothetical protein
MGGKDDNIGFQQSQFQTRICIACGAAADLPSPSFGLRLEPQNFPFSRK